MADFSRRQLARYAVNQLLAKQSPANISKHLAAALIISNKQKDVDLLLDDIAEQLEVRGLSARAVVTSVNGLSAGLRSQLTRQIKKAVRVDEVLLTERLDPSVLGGFRIETSTRTWDQTIARKLAEIKGGI